MQLLLSDQKMEPREAALLSPLQLAYLGDAVWELLVRETLILQKLNVHHMHTECIRRVNAASQAGYMALLQPFLTEEEAAVVQRGRNAHARHPSPRNQNPADYSEATAFEALIGYLYVAGDRSRLSEMIVIILRNGENCSVPQRKEENYAGTKTSEG